MKSVLITGAYGGMGYATVKRLSEQGYKIFALDLNVKEKEENVISIKTDITDINSVKNAFRVVKEYTDKIDYVLHFAGIYNLNSLVEMPEEDFDKIVKVNFMGAFYVNKVFFPLLDSGSKIIITTSELAQIPPLPFTGLYAVTKTALDRYAFALRMELQLLGISVSVLRAGAVKTDMLGVSTSALDKFCNETKLYSCNAERFKRIVNGVEAKHVNALVIAKKMQKIMGKRKPKFAYKVNNNFLLKLYNIMPTRFKFWVIKKILK